MIYVVSISSYGDINRYTFLESTTESFFEGNEEVVIDLVSKQMLDKRHMSLVTGETDKIWFHDTQRLHTESNIESTYLLLCEISNNAFKLVRYNYNDIFCREVVIRNRKELVRLTRLNKVVNCRIRDGKMESVGADTLTKDTEFAEYIDKQYKRYTAMTAILGCEMSFDYTIEGKEVKLQRYTGQSKRIIIPNFITAIMGSACFGQEIEALTINNGLKAIGNYALGKNKIPEVSIPDSVGFIGINAFIDNRGLTNYPGSYTEKIRLMSDNTAALDNYTTNLYW